MLAASRLMRAGWLFWPVSMARISSADWIPELNRSFSRRREASDAEFGTPMSFPPAAALYSAPSTHLRTADHVVSVSLIQKPASPGDRGGIQTKVKPKILPGGEESGSRLACWRAGGRPGSLTEDVEAPRAV